MPLTGNSCPVSKQSSKQLRLPTDIFYKLSQLGLYSMLVSVLADNPAWKFYEVIGAQKVYEKQIETGKVMLNEIAYGWTETKSLLNIK